MIPPPPRSTLFPYTTLFRSLQEGAPYLLAPMKKKQLAVADEMIDRGAEAVEMMLKERSEEHTSELQSRGHLVCRLLLEKKKKNKTYLHKDMKRDNGVVEDKP